MKINGDLLTSLRMVVKPPQEVVDADWTVIADGMVKKWVGIGWVTERQATPEDYEKYPEAEFK